MAWAHRAAAFVAALALPVVSSAADCADVPPDSQYTCAEQQSWGKCSADFMVGHCCQTCFGCAAGCGGPPPPPRPSCVGAAPEMSKSSAGAAAQALFQRLVGLWNAGVTLSGHTGGPKNTIYENSWEDMVAFVGKTPAVKAFDFMSYSPHNPFGTNWTGYDDGQVADAIAWYQSTGGKGIVSFEWHWFSPMGGNKSTGTFYSKDTNFDVGRAVVPGTPEYSATVRDLNAIALQLARLRDAGVPVLWRPLHEAAGNQWGAWFWWGRAGPEACLKLLDMMRDVFINQHRLDHLLWVWSEPNATWYPGNDKMDLVGFDSYPGAYDYDCGESTWNQLAAMSGCRKILTLSEVGPIPDVEACLAKGVRWLYFLTWGTLGRQQNTDQHLKEVYNSPHVKSLQDLATRQVVV